MHSPLAISHISLSQSQSNSSGYGSPNSRSNVNGSQMFDVESPSATSAAKDFLYQRALTPNAVPLLVRFQRFRILATAALGSAVVVVMMVFLRRGVVLRSYRADRSEPSDIESYNVYVGLVTALMVRPLLMLVASVVPAVLLCFLTQLTMQEKTSRKTKCVLALLGNVVLWFLLNGLMAVYVGEKTSRVDAVIRESDLLETESSQSTSTNGTSSAETILRSAMVMAEATAINDAGQCSRASPRRLPAELDYGFPSRQWLSDMLPFAPETTTTNALKVPLSENVETFSLPMEFGEARNLVQYALRATDDYFRELGTEPNASIFELQDLPDNFDSTSSDDTSMTEALIQAANVSLSLAVGIRSHLQNFSVPESSLEFVHFPWTTDSGDVVFKGATLEIPLDKDFLRRQIDLLNDTTQSVVYGSNVLKGLFEINAKEECGRNGCVVSPVGASLTTAPVDEGSQVRALPVCLDVNGKEDYAATMNVDGTQCEHRSSTSMLVFSFAKRIVGDAISSSLSSSTTSNGSVVMLTNARKIYQITAGKLSWQTTDLAAKFRATCKASDCNGLVFPLSDSQRQVIVGFNHIPVTNLSSYSPDLLSWTPLVTSNVQEVDRSDILKSDFVFPRNFEDSSDWTPINGARCERERGAFMDRVESSHMYSEKSLQPAYQSALFWLFQNGVVKQQLGQTTLAFDDSVKHVDVTLSVPEWSAILTFVGCALIFVMAVLIVFGGKRREADVERHFKPHHLARVLLDDEAFSHRLLKCDLLNVGNKYLDSSELLDQFEISGLALRHRKRPSDVLIVPKAQSTTASAASSQPAHVV